MIPKQDRQAARTPADLEQKYNFANMSSGGGKSTAELTRQISQLNQTLTEYMVSSRAKDKELTEQIDGLNKTLTEYMQTTDARLEELSGASGEGLKDYIDNIIIELSGIDVESGE